MCQGCMATALFKHATCRSACLQCSHSTRSDQRGQGYMTFLGLGGLISLSDPAFWNCLSDWPARRLLGEAAADRIWLDPHSLLNLEQKDSEKPAAVKKTYWRLSLLIHPDKCGHPCANDAFQAVTKAAEALQVHIPAVFFPLDESHRCVCCIICASRYGSEQARLYLPRA